MICQKKFFTCNLYSSQYTLAQGSRQSRRWREALCPFAPANLDRLLPLKLVSIQTEVTHGVITVDKIGNVRECLLKHSVGIISRYVPGRTECKADCSGVARCILTDRGKVWVVKPF